MEMQKDWIENIVSAWCGHRKFAAWLVAYMKPKVIVDLGVDWGYSTFVFGNAVRENNLDTKVIGVDLFEGDIHTSFRNTYEKVSTDIEQHSLPIELVKKDFTQYSKEFDKEIDILHIDGLHTYEAIKNDYQNWSKFVSRKGVILMHDVCIHGYGIKKFFTELYYPGEKFYFTHSAGLGVLTENKELSDAILKEFKNIKDHRKEPLF